MQYPNVMKARFFLLAATAVALFAPKTFSQSKIDPKGGISADILSEISKGAQFQFHKRARHKCGQSCHDRHPFL